MRYLSTRGAAPPATLSQAIQAGAAPDGGLYMPEAVPAADLSRLDGDSPLARFAAFMLAPFFAGDGLEAELPSICAEAFTFPAPLVTPDPARPGLRALELFHGPTGAFKDFGARFLMACLDRLGRPAEPLTVLAATSGDTGGAVGCAAEGRNGVGVLILYPRGRVSAFQELQLTCWGDPVRALEVDGDFDACQALVKAAFADRALRARHHLTSANSINVARLLPQAAYLAHASMRQFAADRVPPGLIIPTGNLGHGFAAVYARAMGFPIGPILLATNANATLHDWHTGGPFDARPSLATLANAMDVGNPSNFERLAHLPPDIGRVVVERVDDHAIRDRIAAEHRASGYVWCPHSATAAEAYARLPASSRGERSWIAAVTAHPFKFAEVVEPNIDQPVAPPPALASLLGRSQSRHAIVASPEAVASVLDQELV